MCPPHKSGSFIKFPGLKKQYLKPWQDFPTYISWKQTEGLSILSLTAHVVFLAATIPSLYTE